MVGVSLKTSSTTLVIFFPVITVSFISDMATCQQCQQTFGRTNSLTRHLREKHGQNQIRTECQFCTKTFARPKHYRRHLQTQHNELKLSRWQPIRAPFAQTRSSSAKTTYENTCKVALPFKRSSIKANRLQRIFSH